MSEKETDRPWLCADFSERNSSGCEIIGNREGYVFLKEKINSLLETGYERIDENGIEWYGLRLNADDPRNKPIEKGGVKDLVSVCVFGSLLFLVGFVFVAGVIQIYGWF